MAGSAGKVTTVVSAQSSSRMPLSIATQIGYSVGHIMNDLCSSCWFTYLIIYFTRVLGYSQSMAGVLCLTGQFADGICGPFFAVLIDKSPTSSCYPRRKSWHALGTGMVALAFTFIFHECLNCSDKPMIVQQIYFSVFIVTFQWGWGIVQTAHLSLLPVLTNNSKKIVLLSSTRSSLTFLSGIVVYSVMWLLLRGSDSTEVGPGDDRAFNYLSYAIISTGFIFSALFHILVKEPRELATSTISNQTSEESKESKPSSSSDSSVSEIDYKLLVNVKPLRKSRSIFKWLRFNRFYLISFMYLCARVCCNIPQVYIPLYLTKTLELDKASIACYPLMILIFSVAGSFLGRFVDKRLGHKLTFTLGSITVCASCAWFYIQDKAHHQYTYGAAALIGVGSSAQLILSLSLMAELIGDDTANGSFVYGATSFIEKVFCGTLIALLQYYNPEDCTTHCDQGEISAYYRYTIALVPSFTALLSLVSTLLLHIVERKGKIRSPRPQSGIYTVG